MHLLCLHSQCNLMQCQSTVNILWYLPKSQIAKHQMEMQAHKVVEVETLISYILLLARRSHV